jgi:hypothetical protein
MAEPRCPGGVADPSAVALGEVGPGLDTDADGSPDTAVVEDGVDLVLLTDLDADGWVDQVLRIGPDGVARRPELRPDDPLDDLAGSPTTELDEHS